MTNARARKDTGPRQASCRTCGATMHRAVAVGMHNRGADTLLLEHLISLAGSRRVRAFTAETLSDNALMLQVFADAGLPARRALADGVYEIRFPLPTDEADAALGTYRDAVAEREVVPMAWHWWRIGGCG